MGLYFRWPGHPGDPVVSSPAASAFNTILLVCARLPADCLVQVISSTSYCLRSSWLNSVRPERSSGRVKQWHAHLAGCSCPALFPLALSPLDPLKPQRKHGITKIRLKGLNFPEEDFHTCPCHVISLQCDGNTFFDSWLSVDDHETIGRRTSHQRRRKLIWDDEIDILKIEFYFVKKKKT